MTKFPDSNLARRDRGGSELSAADALRQSEERFRDVFEHSAIGMALVGADGRWLRVNPALCQILGYTSDELLARTFQEVTHPDDLDADLAYLRSLLAGEIRTFQCEKRYVHRSGKIVWALLTVSTVGDVAKTVPYFVSQIQDITDRKQSEDELRRQAVVFETIGDAVIVMDTTGRIIGWNPGAIRLFGYTRDEILGRLVVTIHEPDLEGKLEEAIQASLRTTGRWAGEVPFRRKDGSHGIADAVVVTQYDDDGSPVAWIGVNRDITEQRRLEDQLRHVQKMEAVGQLAGGVAHDFNNLLTVIKTYAEFLVEQLDESNPLHGDVVEIQRAAGRAASLTRQLLAFSRKQVLRPKILDLNAIVGGIEPMLRRLIGEDIQVVIRASPGLGRIRADPGQTEQVIMNLAVNARDAMPGGGTLTIETANVELDDAYAARRSVIVPGAYVMVSVTDTGTGMDAVTRSRIFEPFFTTKEVGKGTGLGLSTVYGIVKQSGGYVWAYSEPGHGSTFKVYFPRTDDDSTKEQAADDAAEGVRGTEVVLLVEDDDAVRLLARRILERYGYTVLEARDGQDALRVASLFREQIDVLVTDIVMPELGGRDVYERLRPTNPDLRVLYMSGYTADDIVRRGLGDSGVLFLQKPFTAVALARAVRTILGDEEGVEE